MQRRDQTRAAKRAFGRRRGVQPQQRQHPFVARQRMAAGVKTQQFALRSQPDTFRPRLRRRQLRVVGAKAGGRGQSGQQTLAGSGQLPLPLGALQGEWDAFEQAPATQSREVQGATTRATTSQTRSSVAPAPRQEFTSAHAHRCTQVHTGYPCALIYIICHMLDITAHGNTAFS